MTLKEFWRILSKKELGQFYTKQSQYIMQGLLDIFPKDAIVVDPFAGEFDLLNLLSNKKEAYDIDPKNNETVKRNTLLNPPSYSGKWVITNPPYLARNKTEDKTLFDKYDLDDLYKISLKTIMTCEGGAIVLPINFLSSVSFDIRKDFLSNFVIQRVNVFQERVFEDTSYTVCSFNFIKRKNEEQEIDFFFFPEKEKETFVLKKEENYTFGGEIYNLKKSSVNVKRLLMGQQPNSNLFLYAVDTGTKGGEIRLEMKDYFYGKNTDRAFATIVLDKNFTKEEQEKIVTLFNEKLDHYRKKYRSLFLPNYRDKYRKRIPFKLAYLLISNCILNIEQ